MPYQCISFCFKFIKSWSKIWRRIPTGRIYFVRNFWLILWWERTMLWNSQDSYHSKNLTCFVKMNRVWNVLSSFNYSNIYNFVQQLKLFHFDSVKLYSLCFSFRSRYPRYRSQYFCKLNSHFSFNLEEWGIGNRFTIFNKQCVF